MAVLLWLAIILFILWVLGFAVFHIASFLIHLLLIIAIIMLIVWAIRTIF